MRASPLVVFDLDDTLFLERDFARSGYAAVETRLRERHPTVSGFADLCLALLDAGSRARIFDEAAARIGLSLAPDELAELVETYRSHRPAIALAPDARRYFRKHGTALLAALVTDGPARTQEAKIKALGLDRILPCIVCTGHLGPGFGKPHARPFAIVEDWASPFRRPLVYVADNPAKDFVTPNARGWLTVQIERVGKIHPSHAIDRDHAARATIGSLDDLDACLAGLAA